MELECHMDTLGCMIREKAAATTHVVFACLTKARKQLAFGRTNEGVDRDALTRKQVFFLQGSLLVSNLGSHLAGQRSVALFSKLTGCAFWNRSDFACCCMQSSIAGTQTQCSSAKKELNSSKIEVSKLEMPAEELLLGF